MAFDRTKIDKFVGMLGSEHDGERLNALRFIQKIAIENKLSMVEFFSAAYGGGERIVYQERIVYRDAPQYQPSPGASGTRSQTDESIRAAQERMKQRKSKAYGHATHGNASLAQKILNILETYSSNLTEWEIEFLENIGPRVESGMEMSPKQRAAYAKIVDKVESMAL